MSTVLLCEFAREQFLFTLYFDVFLQLKSVLNLVDYKISVMDSSDYEYVEKVVKFMEKFYV